MAVQIAIIVKNWNSRIVSRACEFSLFYSNKFISVKNRKLIIRGLNLISKHHCAFTKLWRTHRTWMHQTKRLTNVDAKIKKTLEKKLWRIAAQIALIIKYLENGSSKLANLVYFNRIYPTVSNIESPKKWSKLRCIRDPWWTDGSPLRLKLCLWSPLKRV